MKYGFYVFNNLKGYKDLAIFDDKEKAIDTYRLLDALWNNEEFCKGFDDLDFQIYYDIAFNQVIGYEENISMDLANKDDIIEDFNYYINDNGLVHYANDDIKLLFDVCVNIPC